MIEDDIVKGDDADTQVKENGKGDETTASTQVKEDVTHVKEDVKGDETTASTE